MMVAEETTSLLTNNQNTSNNASAAMVLPLFLGSLFGSVAVAQNTSANIPQSAQVIDQLSLAVLETVEPPSVQNLSTVSFQSI